MAKLSEYELQRLARIAQNEAEIARLGIKPLIPKVAKRATSRRAPKRAREPTRTSTRVKQQAEDEDYVESSDSDEDETSSSIPKPKREKAQPKEKKAKTTEVLSSGLVTVERAKTGRSKCRKCMEKLEEGEYRVGMQAWIMGRQAVTWQHPACFTSKIHVIAEASGRGKCKASGEQFCKGEIKIGLTSHTNTVFVKPEAVPSLLAPVFTVVPDFKIADIQGLDDLSKLEKVTVKEAFMMLTLLTAPVEVTEVKEEEEKAPQEATSRPESPQQPKAGKKTSAKGRVAWRFGGSICFGSLLPQQETGTHCYARTHKGNTKTLAKGRDYWWLESA
jgi:hypothetical protein